MKTKNLFDAMKDILSDKVKEVRISKRLKSHPVCLSADGEFQLKWKKLKCDAE